jgi:hypothetical protein
MTPLSRIFLFCLLAFQLPGFALAQSDTFGKLFVETAWRMQGALLLSGQGGILEHPQMQPHYLTPEAIAGLGQLQRRLDPFSGRSDPKYTTATVSEDYDPNEGGWLYEVSVVNSEDSRKLMVRLEMIGGAFRISNISGEDEAGAWSLKGRDMTRAEIQPRGDTPDNRVAVGLNGIDDGFDRTELGADWQIEQPDDQRYLLEDSALLILVAGDRSALDSPEPPNLLMLQPIMPEAAYIAELSFRLDGQAGDESLSLALRSGPENFIGVEVSMLRTGCGPDLILRSHNKRALQGNEPPFHSVVEYPLLTRHLSQDICGPEGRSRADAILNALRQDGGTLRLIRDDWQYNFQFQTMVDGRHVAFSAGLMSRFEPMPNLVVLAGKDAAAPGTGTVQIDHFSMSLN